MNKHYKFTFGFVDMVLYKSDYIQFHYAQIWVHLYPSQKKKSGRLTPGQVVAVMRTLSQTENIRKDHAVFRLLSKCLLDVMQ